MLDYGGTPADWIARGGRPARVLGDHTHSYEYEDGSLVVYELDIVERVGQTFMTFPRWYGSVAILAPDETVPLHHHPGALWKWRPSVRKWRMFPNGASEWSYIGSQSELGWRHGLGLAEHVMHGAASPEELTEWDRAQGRALELLRENLTPQQRLDLALTDKFRVRGAKTKNLYAIEIGNGFDILSPKTMETVMSYCFHPEQWIPDGDIALATKLALEDEELEEEVLSTARYNGPYRERLVTREDLVAQRFEEELIT